MLTLGLDLSTQSLTAVLVRGDGQRSPTVLAGASQAFHPWIEGYGLRADTLTLPPHPQLTSSLQQGQHDQPPGMFLAALDAIFNRMAESGFPLCDLAVINLSAQQHGHLYLNPAFDHACFSLAQAEGATLEQRLGHTFAYPRCPIWMTANTTAQAEHLRQALGEEEVLRITGSATPLRFSGLVLRWVAQHYPDCYRSCRRVLLINSFLAAVLTGQPAATLDWGSAAGTLLFHYRGKKWSDTLIDALSEGLEGGAEKWASLLPACSSPLQSQGQIAGYFVQRYGVNPKCEVLIGSGDNPQSKVCATGDLLSMGSSFVFMAQPEGPFHRWANATFDGLGQPFSFVCRTNGALVWDEFRQQLSLTFAQQEELLRQHPPASLPRLEWLPLAESFPPAAPSEHVRKAEQPSDLVALIDTTLADMATACQHVFGRSQRTLSLTGGPSRSPGLASRVEHFWQRPVQLIEDSGAAYGAALAALHRLHALAYRC